MSSSESLSTALDFTDDDLGANRRGELTEHQRGLLRRRRWNALILPGFIFVVLLIALLRGLDAHTSGYPAIVVLLLAVMGVMAFFAYRIWNRVARDLSGRVEMLAGMAQAEIVSGGRYISYTVKLDGKRFTVTQSVYKVFQPEHYRLYYAPTSMTLLTAERINDDSLTRGVQS